MVGNTPRKGIVSTTSVPKMTGRYCVYNLFKFTPRIDPTSVIVMRSIRMLNGGVSVTIMSTISFIIAKSRAIASFITNS